MLIESLILKFKICIFVITEFFMMIQIFLEKEDEWKVALGFQLNETLNILLMVDKKAQFYISIYWFCMN